MPRPGVLALVLVLMCCGALPALAAPVLVRPQPLGENPPQEGETGQRTWARLHQLGGMEGSTALVFLPISAEYIRVLVDDDTMPPEHLSALGPWVNAFLIHFNAYDYSGGAPEDVTRSYVAAEVSLRWGAPAAGDNALIPEPTSKLVLQQEETAVGLWYKATFADQAAAEAFVRDPLKQLRLKTATTEYVFDLAEWSDLELLTEAVQPAPVEFRTGITPLP